MTYGTMQSDIADELARSDLTTQIQKAIQSAIKHYERKNLFFKEEINTFSTVIGQEYYTSSDLADIPNIIAIDSFKVDITGNTEILTATSFSEIDKISSSLTTQGDPKFYAYYSQKIRLYPIPQHVRTLTIAYSAKFSTLSLDADTNAWMTEGYDLIKARAKVHLFENVIRDFEEADRMRAQANELYSALVQETEAKDTGGIKPTQF